MADGEHHPICKFEETWKASRRAKTFGGREEKAVVTMEYNYEREKAWLTTLDGQKDFLRVRDWVQRALEATGAFTLGKAISASRACDSFKMIVAVDRLVELGEVEELPGQTCSSQNRVYRGKR
ncbi:MAG TPA: hypothetical protein VGK73_03920 [Polyangiaceae bacterium]